jgi:hypothetical protein
MLSRGSERNRGCHAGSISAMPDRARAASRSLRSASSDARGRFSRKHGHIKGHFSHLLDPTLPSVSPETDPQDSLASLSFLQNRAPSRSSKLTFDNKGLVKVRIYRLFARARDNGLTRLHRWSSTGNDREPCSRQPSTLVRVRACLACRIIEPAQLLARLLALARRS